LILLFMSSLTGLDELFSQFSRRSRAGLWSAAPAALNSTVR